MKTMGSCSFVINIKMFHHFKYEIELEVSASDEGATDSSEERVIS